MGRVFERVARWTLYAALVFAPWAYGATTPDAIVTLDLLLGTSLSAWVVELILDRRAPRLSPLLLVTIGTILLLGGWMVVNAGSVRDTHYDAFVPIRQSLPGAAGSVDYVLSAAFMVRVSLLLGVVLFVADASRDPKFLLEPRSRYLGWLRKLLMRR
jgi:hypothetical protein